MKNSFCLVLVLVTLTLTFLGRAAHATVWDNLSDWTSQDEVEYRARVAKKWDRNYFNRTGPYKNILMDCADAVYAMRFIYAAEHGLPFAMLDPTGSGRLISNSMSRWDDLDEDSRKREFLQYLFMLASTSSLPKDSYPVAVSRQTIGAGRFLLTDPSSHHSWTIKNLDTHGIPLLLFASRPARVTLFERHEYPTTGFVFPKGLRAETNAGFRAFRRIRDIGKPVWEVPGYSLEQYEIPIKGWTRAIQKKLALKAESSDRGLARILENACRGVKERVEMVSKAERLNRKLGRACLSATQYDDYSTPSRDERLKGTFAEFQSAYKKMVQTGAALSPEVELQIASVLKGDQNLDGSEYCTVEISPEQTLSLGQILTRSVAGYLSSNPHDSVKARWGLERSPGSRAKTCGEY